MKKNIRLLSLNVALFEKNNSKLKKYLEEEQFDIVCLQEVTSRVDKGVDSNYVSKDVVDQATQRLKHSFWGPNWVLRNFIKHNFHRRAIFSIDFGGWMEYGNYIRSKFEIVKAQNIFLQNHFTRITDWSKWPEEDYKGLEVVDLALDNIQKLRVINYHGVWTKDKQGNKITLSACEKINRLAQSVNYPVIICGDFNLFPDTKSLEILNKSFVNLSDKYHNKTTRPSTNELTNSKRNVVDYIFISKEIEVMDFKVVDNKVSDHLPLVAELTI